MSSQDLIIASKIASLRELKAKLRRVNEENCRLKGEVESLKACIGQAMLSAKDLESLAPGGRMHIWDGWNLVLGANRIAKDRAGLVALAQEHLSAHPDDFVWIVFDGSEESSMSRGRLRISYTGGIGCHRADKFILDYVRMAGYLGLVHLIEVRTDDKRFASQVRKLAQSARNLV